MYKAPERLDFDVFVSQFDPSLRGLHGLEGRLGFSFVLSKREALPLYPPLTPHCALVHATRNVQRPYSVDFICIEKFRPSYYFSRGTRNTGFLNAKIRPVYVCAVTPIFAATPTNFRLHTPVFLVDTLMPHPKCFPNKSGTRGKIPGLFRDLQKGL